MNIPLAPIVGHTSLLLAIFSEYAVFCQQRMPRGIDPLIQSRVQYLEGA
jgi:hypothetical protein